MSGATINAGGPYRVLCGVLRSCGVLGGSITSSGGSWNITSFGGAVGSLRDGALPRTCFPRRIFGSAPDPRMTSSGVGGFWAPR